MGTIEKVGLGPPWKKYTQFEICHVGEANKILQIRQLKIQVALRSWIWR